LIEERIDLNSEQVALKKRPVALKSKPVALKKRPVALKSKPVALKSVRIAPAERRGALIDEHRGVGIGGHWWAGFNAISGGRKSPLPEHRQAERRIWPFPNLSS